MAVFQHPDFDNHEQVAFFQDKATGLQAIIAVHNTNLGASLGGCRMYAYNSPDEALTDVLRLSKGMTYKAAMAGLPQGGGKAVIIGDPRTQKSSNLMKKMGECVNKLNGSYVIAEDSGIAVSDLIAMKEKTSYVAGDSARFSVDGTPADGNPAPATSFGVFCGLRAAVKQVFQSDLQGKTIAIQGVGHVGARLAGHLHKAGAKLIVADIFEENAHRVAEEFGATIVSTDAIHAVDCDVFAPCALGGAINRVTINEIKAPVIAGAANNQLATVDMDSLLVDKGIVYAPDYVINAGGIIDIYHQRSQHGDENTMRRQLEAIGETVLEILTASKAQQRGSQAVANELAEQRFSK